VGENSFYVEHGDWFVGVSAILVLLGYATLRFVPAEPPRTAAVE
jgi:hypothetical protein